MDDEQDFRDLMRQVQAGSEEAARRLCDVYGSHILRVVRRRLPDHLRSKFDSIDFVQDVWASFFADPPQELGFDNPNALVAYLVRRALWMVVLIVLTSFVTFVIFYLLPTGDPASAFEQAGGIGETRLPPPRAAGAPLRFRLWPAPSNR